MAYKRLEEHCFTWPAVTDGLMLVNHAQFEALFAGIDWRRVRAIEAKAPEAVECAVLPCGRMTRFVL